MRYALSLVTLLTLGLAACSSDPDATAVNPSAQIAAPGVTGTDAAVTPPGTTAPGQSAPEAVQAPAIGRAPAGVPPASAARSGSVGAAPSAASPAPTEGPVAASPSAPPAPVWEEITVPSGTPLSVELKTALGSDTSRVEDVVRGVLRRPLIVNGEEVVPAGAVVTGHVTAVERSARVKGRASLALRFTSLVVGDGNLDIATAAIAREARGTKKRDAAKIGIGAGAGAVIGAITGGKKGAVVGGTVGAGAGTGVVLATRGEEVDLAAGSTLATTPRAPLVVRRRVE